MPARLKKRLLDELFTLSVALTVLSFWGCCASLPWSITLRSGSPQGDVEWRLHCGGIYRTVRAGGAVVPLTCNVEPIGDSPWPEVSVFVPPTVQDLSDPRHVPGSENLAQRHVEDTSCFGITSVRRSTFEVDGIALWLVMLLLAAYQGWWWTTGRRVRARSGTCAGCGYNLTGLESDHCPECGRRFRWGRAVPVPPMTERARRARNPQETEQHVV
jgi:hypothetical protein